MVLAVIWSENGLQNSSDRSIGQRWHLYRHRELSFEEEAIVFIIEASSFQSPCLVELPYIYHRKCIVINYNVRVYIICSLNCSQSVIGFIPKEKFSNRLTFSVYLFTKEWLLFRKTNEKLHCRNGPPSSILSFGIIYLIITPFQRRNQQGMLQAFSKVWDMFQKIFFSKCNYYQTGSWKLVGLSQTIIGFFLHTKIYWGGTL